MKRLIFLWLVGSGYLQAQDQLLDSSRSTKPSWVGQLQKAVDEYYFNGMGEANNLIEAKEMADKDVIVNIFFNQQGCKISKDEINKTTQKQKGETFEIEGQYYSIMHTKCKDISTEGYDLKDFYWEQWKRENGEIFYRYYKWVSLPKKKLISLNKSMAYSIFPGAGQMYKQEYGRAVAIWGGLVGTGTLSWVFYDRYKYYHDNIPLVSEPDKKYDFTRFERNNKIGLVSSGAAALGIYIWNLYDARHHQNNRTRLSMLPLKIQPYLASSHQGVSIYIPLP